MRGIGSALLALVLCAAVAPGLSAQDVEISAVSCNLSRCPPTLELVDGQPATIRLSGKGLEDLVSGQLTVGIRGLEVQGVTVELGPVPSVRRTRTLTTTRDVTVTARGAPALTDLHLRFATRDGASVMAPLELSIAEVTTEPMPVDAPDAGFPTGDQQELLSVEESIERATPRVTGADRTSVGLRAAGPVETVVLEGSALDRVTGARVQHAGQDVPDVLAEVAPGADPARREISLSARLSARVPWGEPLDLVLQAPDPVTRLTSTYPTPVKVEALGTIRADDRLFLRAINESGILDGANATFNSCGPPRAHAFSVTLPGLSHNRGGAMPRFEYSTTLVQRVEFTEDHSLDPSDPFNPEEFGDFVNTLHPTLFPHTLTTVRMCLADLKAKTWRATGVDVAGGFPRLVVTVELEDALFRARGMPATPDGGITGLNIGIGWGDPITDRELPDLVYPSPRIEVRLPMEVTNGRLRYGSPEVVSATAEPRWSGVFLGSSGVRRRMNEYASNRMTGQIRAEVGRPFEAQATLDRLASVTWSMLQTVNVSELLGLERGADGALRFVYE